MASFDMSIPHHLTQEEALERIKKMLSNVKQEHGDKISHLQENWTGNIGTFSFTIMGFDLSGTLTVNPAAIDLEAELPFAATLFKGKIKTLISEKAEELLRTP